MITANGVLDDLRASRTTKKTEIVNNGLRIKTIMESEWFVVHPGMPLYKELRCADRAIFTVGSNIEVLGVSEWLRCDRSVLRHIIEAHNSTLESATKR